MTLLSLLTSLTL